MNKESKLVETFGKECAVGDNAITFLKDVIKPIMDREPEIIIIFDLQDIIRINRSFANALFGNFYAVYGENHIRIKNVKPHLIVLLIAAFEYGKKIVIKSKGIPENKDSFWEKLFSSLTKK